MLTRRAGASRRQMPASPGADDIMDTGGPGEDELRLRQSRFVPGVAREQIVPSRRSVQSLHDGQDVTHDAGSIVRTAIVESQAGLVRTDPSLRFQIVQISDIAASGAPPEQTDFAPIHAVSNHLIMKTQNELMRECTILAPRAPSRVVQPHQLPEPLQRHLHRLRPLQPHLPPCRIGPQRSPDLLPRIRTQRRKIIPPRRANRHEGSPQRQRVDRTSAARPQSRLQAAAPRRRTR